MMKQEEHNARHTVSNTAASSGSHAHLYLLGGSWEALASPLQSEHCRVIEGREESHQCVEVVVLEQSLKRC